MLSAMSVVLAVPGSARSPSLNEIVGQRCADSQPYTSDGQSSRQGERGGYGWIMADKVKQLVHRLAVLMALPSLA